jgi:hypothetical protein
VLKLLLKTYNLLLKTYNLLLKTYNLLIKTYKNVKNHVVTMLLKTGLRPGTQPSCLEALGSEEPCENPPPWIQTRTARPLFSARLPSCVGEPVMFVYRVNGCACEKMAQKFGILL